MTRTELIKQLLVERTFPDLAAKYNHDMECQINVLRKGGELVRCVDDKGMQYTVYTDKDQIETWSNFRIPKGAADQAVYVDGPPPFDLRKYTEGIGLTGWDWKNKRSLFFGFDFDSAVGHKGGLTDIELQETLAAVMNIDWVTVRRSTSGSGYHFYIDLETPIHTENHTEHAAVARAILGKLSVEANFPFDAKVDVCGHILWFWHTKKEGTNGLELIKQGSPLRNIPHNWRDHIEVVTGKRKKIKAKVENDLLNNHASVGLDQEHIDLILFLEDSNSYYDADNNFLISHTYLLKKAHKELKMKGIYDTVSSGKDCPHDINCFAFPLPMGGWNVYRFSQGIKEHKMWKQDGSGWTSCYFNRHADLDILARAHEAVESETGWYHFATCVELSAAIKTIGIDLALPTFLDIRKAKIKKHKDGRVIIKIQTDTLDDGHAMKGWEAAKDKMWTRIFTATAMATDDAVVDRNYDNLVRHVVTQDFDDAGYLILDRNNRWITECLPNVKMFLKSHGKSANNGEEILGLCVQNPWKLVRRPFEEEFPGGRVWNRNAPQYNALIRQPTDKLSFPTWELIFNHLGKSLDTAVLDDPWCIQNHITLGAQYLKLWVASLLQCPRQPLPYLFFYGEQGSGKSIFHEAISLLITSGYVRADQSIQSISGFNGELDGAVLCVIEETNLGQNKKAYSHLKDWVTSIKIPIHKKGMTPITVDNTTHWCQFANEQDACPVFTGDKRVTFVFVNKLENEIPKKVMLKKLRDEAADFLTEMVQRTEIPETNSRLNVPPIQTQEMASVQLTNESVLAVYLRDNCFYAPGELITIADFFKLFTDWLRINEPTEIYNYPSARKVTSELQGVFLSLYGQTLVRGHRTRDNNWCYANISFSKPYDLDKVPYVAIDNMLRLKVEGT